MTEPFSVLLPVYGRDDPDHFRRAFSSSVVDQHLRPDEVVLVQDGPVSAGLRSAIEDSIDSASVPVHWLVLERNGGLAAALNAGLDAASHDIVARMDADDIARPERFERQLPLLSEGFDLVGSGMFEFELDDAGAENIVGRRTPPSDLAGIRKHLRFQSPFNHPTVVYRRAAVRRAGGYKAIEPMEDYLLWAHMLSTGSRAMNLPDPLVLYRVSSGAWSRRGGLRLVGAEVALQRGLRAERITTAPQMVRNLVVRGGYRLLPMSMRRFLYRRALRSGRAARP